MTPARLAALIVMLVAAPVSLALAQSPLTLDSLKALLLDAGTTVSRIDTLNARIYDASARGNEIKADFTKHNAEPCEYPQGHPELCANYDRERVDLNLRVADLQKEWNGYEKERKALRAQFAALMTRLREASYRGETASWKTAMIACSNVNGVTEAATCLTRAVSRHR